MTEVAQSVVRNRDMSAEALERSEEMKQVQYIFANGI
jgi:hypothetical protein